MGPNFRSNYGNFEIDVNYVFHFILNVFIFLAIFWSTKAVFYNVLGVTFCLHLLSSCRLNIYCAALETANGMFFLLESLLLISKWNKLSKLSHI